MKTLAYDRGLFARDPGGRSPAPASSSHAGLWQRAFGAIRLSPWAPVVGKVIVGIAALLALAALGQNALTREASAASLDASTSSAPDPPRFELPKEASAHAVTSSPEMEPSPSPIEDKPPSATLPDGRIVLNLASETELTKLPGIGPKRAQAILALRQRLGRFRRVEDLLRVKGIGRKMLDRLRPAVILDPPPD